MNRAVKPVVVEPSTKETQIRVEARLGDLTAQMDT